MTALVDGRFRLLERVGAGGMGVVHRAIDERDGATVAIKLLTGRNPSDLARAHREAEILARLSHPAIVRHIADGTTADGALYLAMAWVEGTTVATRLAEDGFSVREAVAMTRRIADALAAAHRAQVLHRDIKPSNVLLADDAPDAAVLIDFGVSRLGDALQALTRTGVTIGTPGYMSPEQARGERDLTPAADVFALGCVLYECLTAKPAFSGMHSAAVLVKILFGDPQPLEVVCREAPAGLIALVAAMLAKDPARRLPDCEAVVRAIDALGALPAGPRRSARSQISEPTRVAPPVAIMHCLVSAARGNPDDVLEPPTAAECAALAGIAAANQADLELLATGGVVIHITGEAHDAAARAALIALAMRKLLTSWSIAISSLRADVQAAAEGGAALLTSAAMAAIFTKRPPSIVVDPGVATLLSGEFELEMNGRDDPRLIARR